MMNNKKNTKNQVTVFTEKDSRKFWWIRINGLPIGYVDPNTHELYISASWCRSQKIEMIRVTEGINGQTYLRLKL